MTGAPLTDLHELVDRQKIDVKCEKCSAALAVTFGEARQNPTLRCPNGHAVRIQADMSELDQLLGKSQDAASAAAAVASFLVRKGRDASAAGDLENALATFDGVARTFGDTDDPDLRDTVTSALFDKALALRKLDRYEEEVRTWGEVLARYGVDPPAERQLWGLRALTRQAFALSVLRRDSEAIATCDDALRRAAGSTDCDVRVPVAEVFLYKARALRRLDGSAAAVTVLEELLARFGEAREPVLRTLVAQAMFEQGADYATLKRREAAVAAFENVIATFASDDSPTAIQAVSAARHALDQLHGGATD